MFVGVSDGCVARGLLIVAHNQVYSACPVEQPCRALPRVEL